MGKPQVCDIETRGTEKQQNTVCEVEEQYNRALRR